MNNEQRNIYWLQWERRRNRIEGKYRRQIFAALQNQVSKFTGSLKSYTNVTQARNDINDVQFYELGSIIKALYIESGLKQASVTYRQIRQMQAKFVGMGFNQEWTNAIIKN